MYFYSRASREARLYSISNFLCCVSISTHAPLARRDFAVLDIHNEQAISTHAPLARRDVHFVQSPSFSADFYSRASREARLADAILDGRKKFISTHAPLARRDALKIEKIHDRLNFYSRASREARHNVYSGLSGAKNFYSRASREARPTSPFENAVLLHFYSRASREARR